ncbi:MAG: serine hydrolase [Ruminococcus sp.]|nr:serine hydrolase [Ruminococcus sp.]
MNFKKTISVILSLLTLISTLAISPNASAQASNDTLVVDFDKTENLATVSSLNAYDKYLENMMNNFGITGVSYVTQDGKVIAQHSSGMQNSKDNIPMSRDTLFPIGSISKQFCATAIMMLQQQGKLSVDDTLEKYFPEYEIGKDITIKNLLSMRSGIRDHVNPDEDYVGHEIPTNEYLLSETATYKENIKTITDWLFTQKLKFEPGTDHAYSNSNFLLLSIIVEDVSGIKYSQFIKENIFKPLNMTNSGFYEELYGSPDFAEDVLPDDVELLPPYFHLSTGSGDLVSNAPDMDKWLTSISKRTLLTDESYDEMTTDYGSEYCYGIQAQKGSYFHQGDITTFESFALTNPAKNLNIFVVTNDVQKIDENNYNMSIYGFAIFEKLSSSKAKLGDVDSDGVVSILDATAIQMHFAQIKTLSSKQLRYGDTDGDGEVSVLDATELQLHLAQQ